MDPLSLLNLDDLDDQQAPDAPPVPDGGGAGGTSPDEDSTEKKRIAELEEGNKQLQEKVRQIAESSKPAQDFFNKIMGHNEDEASKKKAQEILVRYEQDPVGVTNELIKQNLVPLEEAIMKTVSTGTVKEAMTNLDKTHTIDWAKDHPKIVEQLAKFKEEDKKKDPQGILLSACKLAGVVTDPAPGPVPPVSEGGGRPGGPPVRKVEGSVNDRLNKIGTRKKDNVFNL